jgi:hypothetical protein
MSTITLIQDAAGPRGPRAIEVEVVPGGVLGFDSQGVPVSVVATPEGIGADPAGTGTQAAAAAVAGHNESPVSHRNLLPIYIHPGTNVVTGSGSAYSELGFLLLETGATANSCVGNFASPTMLVCRQIGGGPSAITTGLPFTLVMRFGYDSGTTANTLYRFGFGKEPSAFGRSDESFGVEIVGLRPRLWANHLGVEIESIALEDAPSTSATYTLNVVPGTTTDRLELYINGASVCVLETPRISQVPPQSILGMELSNGADAVRRAIMVGFVGAK